MKMPLQTDRYKCKNNWETVTMVQCFHQCEKIKNMRKLLGDLRENFQDSIVAKGFPLFNQLKQGLLPRNS